MLLLRRKQPPVQPPTGQTAITFRRILFSPPDEPEDTLSLTEWEQIDLRCVHILKTKTLQASCLTRGLAITGSRDTIALGLFDSLNEQKTKAIHYHRDKDAERQQHLDSLGGVWSFGSGYTGQLGHGNLESCGTPMLVRYLRDKDIKSVHAGYDSDLAFAISRNGDVFVWGRRKGPCGLPNGRDISSHEMSDLHTECSMKEKDLSSQEFYDDGFEDFIMIPTKVPRLCGEGVDYIAVGSLHCYAKTRGGDLYTWGDKRRDQLGHPSVLTDQMDDKADDLVSLYCHEPQLCTDNIPSDCVITSVGVSTYSAFAASDEGALIAFGGLSDTLFSIVDNVRVKKVSCGVMHAGIVCMKGHVYTWGSGDGGRLGHGNNISHSKPKIVEELRNDIMVDIACAVWHTVALTFIPPLRHGGLIYTWGTGRFGQLAQGAMQYCSVPTVVEDLVASHVFVRKICAGAFHNAALSLDGEVFTWGTNTGGCLGRPKELHDLEESFCAVPGRVEGLVAKISSTIVGTSLPGNDDITSKTCYSFK
uniref:Uncharacterized protein AlNc14C1G104 n=1 Tax=Albugo laibachii Nc14 TaxID=890382 RepID=F0VYV3_9STRA|nr:conserved hypothetical protein [Albugo laibachii Nc14]|eukprot:CCA13968.1 conserved hypothetical protein [Albugo laibachii Nc14]